MCSLMKKLEVKSLATVSLNGPSHWTRFARKCYPRIGDSTGDIFTFVKNYS